LILLLLILFFPAAGRAGSMTYEEAIRFWFGRVNFEQRIPLADDLKLDRMRTLLARLGDPQDRLRIVHVAGSKGKGSTAAMLASVITSISLDHTQALGNTPELIAREKAGIIKPGRPVISGVSSGGPRDVIAEIAGARGAPLRQLGADFEYRYEPALVGAGEQR